MEMNRRSFLGATAAMGAMAVTATTAMAEFEEASGVAGYVPQDENDLYVMNTSLNELNKARQAMIDACTDITLEDGTVIPELWVKVQMLIDGLGRGTGGFDLINAASMAWYQRLCCNNEEYAQILLKLPMGVRFTITDAKRTTGLDEETLRTALSDMSYTGLIFHATMAGVDHWHVQRYAHGILEASQNLYEEPGFIPNMFVGLGGLNPVPHGMFHAIPCSKDIVIDEKPYILDDFEEMLQRNEVFAVSPCQCHYFNKYLGGALYNGEPCDVPAMGDWDAIRDFVTCDGSHLEKCVTFGEEAEYYIEIGIGRPLTRDEAREHLMRAAEENCILNSVSTEYSEVICCCSGPCLIVGGMKALTPGTESHIMYSNHLLMVDQEPCIKCGMCANRCPLSAITMNEETGYPEVTGACVRCGQCCTVCPVEARKLTMKPVEEIMDMSADLLGTCNDELAYRMENGWYPYEV